MGFTLTVKGQKQTSYYGDQIITGMTFNLDTPATARAKSTDFNVTMGITGKLISTDDVSGDSATLELLDWARLPAENADAYRDVTVEVITTNEATFRKLHLPNAFILNYSERYLTTAGVGSFSLIIRQRADKTSIIETKE